jgi:hypothetical protein
MNINCFALTANTTKDCTACLTEQFLDDMIDFSISKDYQSITTYLNSQKCIRLKQGVKVTITKSPGMFGGKVGFIVNGVRLWTIREGLTNYR